MENENIWLVGEYSTVVSFLSTMLSETTRDHFKSICKSYSRNESRQPVGIRVLYNDEECLEVHEDIVTIKCQAVPAGCQMEWHYFTQEYLCNFIILLFSFRFEKEIEIKLKSIKEQLLRSNYQPQRVKAVLFDDPNIRTGATDLSQSCSELQRMHDTLLPLLKREKLDRIVEVIQYQGDRDIIFGGGDNTLCYISDILKDTVDQSRKNFAWEAFDGFVLEEWNENNCEEITKYDRIRNSNDLILSYTDAFFDSKVWLNALNILHDEYFRCMNAVSFWNMESEWARIEALLKQQSKAFLMRAHKKITMKGITEVEYGKSMKYDIEFQNNVRTLLMTHIKAFINQVLKDTAFIFQ